MCQPGEPPRGYACTRDALAAVRSGLAHLAVADAASLPTEDLAGCLRELERAESVHTAARARLLAAFTAQAGCEADGQATSKTWLMWQTQISRGAAARATGWMRRLAAHPLVAAALASGQVSASYARAICEASDLLPEGERPAADQILLDAAAGGATLADLSGLVQEMLSRCAPPDTDGHDDGFDDRSLQLDIHFRGSGRLTGNLTPECAAGLTAVLESLGKRRGPEDDRSKGERHHDALEDACRRLTGGGDLPDVAGQPALVQLHLTLDQLRHLDGAAGAEAAWAAGRAAGDGQPGWISSPAAAQAYACDAQISPVVAGHVDRAALALLIRRLIAQQARPPGCRVTGCSCQHGDGDGALGNGAPVDVPPRGTSQPDASAAGAGASHDRAGQPPGPLGELTDLEDIVLRYAADVMSGPDGLASWLRTALPGPQAAAASLPLDVGATTRTIPPHLRRAVINRDRHCAFPGCHERPAGCQVHHIVPRSRGGTTSLTNCLLLCSFHHLIAIHRWGWTIALNGDGTTTAISPDRDKILRSHGPPETAAA